MSRLPVQRLSTAHEGTANHLMDAQLALPAYEQVLKAAHTFNLLDARGAISVTERAAYIGRIRNLARAVGKSYLDSRARLGFPMAPKAHAEEVLAELAKPPSSRPRRPGALVAPILNQIRFWRPYLVSASSYQKYHDRKESPLLNCLLKNCPPRPCKSWAMPLPRAVRATASPGPLASSRIHVLRLYASPRRLGRAHHRSAAPGRRQGRVAKLMPGGRGPRTPQARPPRRCSRSWPPWGADASAVAGLQREGRRQGRSLVLRYHCQGCAADRWPAKSPGRSLAKLPIPKVMTLPAAGRAGPASEFRAPGPWPGRAAWQHRC